MSGPKRTAWITGYLIAAAISAPAPVGAADVSAQGGIWSLNAGIDIDDESGYIAGGGVSYMPNERLLLSADVGRSDSSTDLADFKSTFASLLADYSFGPVGLSATAGWYSDDDIADRFRYGGSVYAQGRGFRLELTAEDWRSEFDTFRFDGRIDRTPPLPPVRISTTADCQIDNTAFGARAGFTGERFGAYLSAREYDYSMPDCRFGVAINGRPQQDIGRLVDAAPELFRRLATATVGATRLRLIGSDATFLDNSIGAGVSWRRGELLFGLDYYHSREIFQKLEADTGYARVLFPIGAAADLELRIGVSDGDQAGSIAIAGATVFWYLAGGS
ncbi:MAG: hypothetical protein ACE5G3_10965 [Gammaproteobacteria bacterium]